MDAANDDATTRGRQLLRANWGELREARSDQERGIPAPELEKPCAPGSPTVPLPAYSAVEASGPSVAEALVRRRSRRRYAGTPLSLEELSFLLYATGGVRETRGAGSLRTAPSAGARHSLETYVAAHRVSGLEAGLWRYLPLEHRLCQVSTPSDLEERVTEALLGQGWSCAAVLIWTAIPYRMEWRYGVVSHKLILLDAGHACQNLYLACECVGCGTCAIGAYDQERLDAFLGVDGSTELAVYAATVGKV